MDCRTAQFFLALGRLREAELDEADAQALATHLAGCPVCGPQAEAEKAFDRQLAQVMQDVAIPKSLPHRLHEQVARYRRRRWLAYAGMITAAAALLLGVWLGIQWRHHYRPVPDLDLLHDQVLVEVVNPRPEKLLEWLHRNDIDVPPPPQFNYALLRHYYITRFQGKPVPLLLFAHGNRQARVYLLSDQHFDLNGLRAGQQQGSGVNLAVQFHPSDHHVAYVIVYEGDSLADFLVGDEPPAT
ncbi:MAG: hypothetical protein KatS3mg105_2570 [Gemmatales bacterium]|nr:MAG: hypothetical protein KatS3mg105_2570 [Gemmatales bacterium]